MVYDASEEAPPMAGLHFTDLAGLPNEIPGFDQLDARREPASDRAL